jgi:DNA-binding MarR family transcriptional regulator
VSQAHIPLTVSSAPPWECTDTKLHQLTRAMNRHYDAELGKAGLRTTQFWLLTEVLVRGPVCPGDLADAMDLDPSTVTRNLKPLLALGWLELGPGKDGRTRTIRITPAGRRKRAEGVRHWTAAQTRLAGLLGSRNLSELNAVISDCLQACELMAKQRRGAATREFAPGQEEKDRRIAEV